MHCAFVECKGFPFDAFQLPQPVEARLGPAGVLAVGPAGDLHLQQAHLDPHLEHFPAVAGADQPRGDDPRLEGPPAENEVDVVLFGHGRILAGIWRLGEGRCHATLAWHCHACVVADAGVRSAATAHERP